jgi:hypothetical protein
MARRQQRSNGGVNVAASAAKISMAAKMAMAMVNHEKAKHRGNGGMAKKLAKSGSNGGIRMAGISGGGGGSGEMAA